MPLTNKELKRWVYQQYDAFAVNSKGDFMGKKKFAALLVREYSKQFNETTPEKEIRRVVKQ